MQPLNSNLIMMLAASQEAQQYFREASQGHFQDKNYHDLCYDHCSNQFLTQTFNYKHEYEPNGQIQPISRITENTLKDYEQFLGQPMDISNMGEWYKFALHEEQILERELALKQEPELEL
jgi:hypothetical protein